MRNMRQTVSHSRETENGVIRSQSSPRFYVLVSHEWSSSTTSCPSARRPRIRLRVRESRRNPGERKIHDTTRKQEIAIRRPARAIRNDGSSSRALSGPGRSGEIPRRTHYRESARFKIYRQGVRYLQFRRGGPRRGFAIRLGSSPSDRGRSRVA